MANERIISLPFRMDLKANGDQIFISNAGEHLDSRFRDEEVHGFMEGPVNAEVKSQDGVQDFQEVLIEELNHISMHLTLKKLKLQIEVWKLRKWLEEARKMANYLKQRLQAAIERSERPINNEVPIITAKDLAIYLLNEKRRMNSLTKYWDHKNELLQKEREARKSWAYEVSIRTNPAGGICEEPPLLDFPSEEWEEEDDLEEEFLPPAEEMKKSRARGNCWGKVISTFFCIPVGQEEDEQDLAIRHYDGKERHAG
ncbi:uncharacterized protein [Ambystoma mexicanum]|uniref:uncharacterized protein n=1 Tax=Ambystoma mexicanum TaxID=8296 RepID=UPI0037E8B603